MSERTYTVLRVTSQGTVPLRKRHVDRLGQDCAEAFITFAKDASAGIYRVWWDGASKSISFESVARSRLSEGMSLRHLTVRRQRGRVSKTSIRLRDGTRARGRDPAHRCERQSPPRVV